jgi:hypothetical protein
MYSIEASTEAIPSSHECPPSPPSADPAIFLQTSEHIIQSLKTDFDELQEEVDCL